MPTPYTSIRQIIAMLALALLGAAAWADTVTLRDGKVIADVTVTKVDDSSVHCDGRAAIPRGDVATITRDAFAVPAMATGLSLRDGTVISGRVRSFKSGTITVRSVSFGLLKVPLKSVAAIRYHVAADQPLPERPDGDAAATVLRRDGTRTSGQLMWADAETVGLLTDQGLERINADTLAGVVIAPVPPTAAVVLRNADRVATVATLKGDRLTVDVAGTEVTLPLAAVFSLNLQPATKE